MFTPGLRATDCLYSVGDNTHTTLLVVLNTKALRASVHLVSLRLLAADSRSAAGRLILRYMECTIVSGAHPDQPPGSSIRLPLQALLGCQKNPNIVLISLVRAAIETTVFYAITNNGMVLKSESGEL